MATRPDVPIGSIMSQRLDELVAIWAVLGGLVLLSIVLATAFNVGTYLSSAVGISIAGFPGYEDFVRLTVSSAALMLFPYCQQQKGHIAVDLFAVRMPRALNHAMAIISMAAMTLLAAFLFYWMVIGMLETRADGAVSRVLQWPEWLFYLPGLISLVLWTLVAARDTANTVKSRPER